MTGCMFRRLSAALRDVTQCTRRCVPRVSCTPASASALAVCNTGRQRPEKLIAHPQQRARTKQTRLAAVCGDNTHPQYENNQQLFRALRSAYERRRRKSGDTYQILHCCYILFASLTSISSSGANYSNRQTGDTFQHGFPRIGLLRADGPHLFYPRAVTFTCREAGTRTT